MDLHKMLRGHRSTDNKINFYDHISKLKQEAHGWLAVIGKNGIDHSERLEQKLDQLIPDDFKRSLKPAGIFILLYAVYLHDIGYRDGNSRINPKDHPRRSKQYILDDPDKYLFGPFRPSHRPGMIPLAAKAVADVCFGHSPENICPLTELDPYFTDEHLSRKPINLILISALLRLADEMDQAYIRVDHGGIREHITNVEIHPGIVRWHWDGNHQVGIMLDQEVRKTNDALLPVNKWLSAGGFPKTTIVLDPPVNEPSPPSVVSHKRLVLFLLVLRVRGKVQPG